MTKLDSMNDKLPVDDKIGYQVIPWMTKEFARGYKARVNRIPFDQSESKEWKSGWWQANWWLHMID